MMTPQEVQSLRDFLTQLTQVQGISKDPQAQALIGEAFAKQPDAGYLLVQRSMLQDQALAMAQSRIAQLESDLQAERAGSRAGADAGGGGFLDPSNAWGRSATGGGRMDSAAFGRAGQSQRFEPVPGQPGQQYPGAQAAAYPGAVASTYPAGQAMYPAAQAVPPQRSGFFGGGGSGFLGNMAATAAGVAGGAFLFQGLGSLLGGHGGGFGQAHHETPVENTTVNNFYGADDAPVASKQGIADAGIDDLSASNDFGNSDDLGSSDDISAI